MLAARLLGWINGLVNGTNARTGSDERQSSDKITTLLNEFFYEYGLCHKGHAPTPSSLVDSTP